jgi:hypothetical protein
VVGVEDDVGVEHSKRLVELAIARGGKERLDSLACRSLLLGSSAFCIPR